MKTEGQQDLKIDGEQHQEKTENWKTWKSWSSERHNENPENWTPLYEDQDDAIILGVNTGGCSENRISKIETWKEWKLQKWKIWNEWNTKRDEVNIQLDLLQEVCVHGLIDFKILQSEFKNVGSKPANWTNW